MQSITKINKNGVQKADAVQRERCGEEARGRKRLFLAFSINFCSGDAAASVKLFSTRIHEIGGVLPRHKKEKQSLSLMDIFEKLLEDDTKAPSASYLRRSFGYAQLSFFCCVNRA